MIHRERMRLKRASFALGRFARKAQRINRLLELEDANFAIQFFRDERVDLPTEALASIRAKGYAISASTTRRPA